MDEFDDLIKLQNQIRQGLEREQRVDNTLSIMTIINELTANSNNTIQKEAIIIEAGNKGIEEREVDKILERLKIDKVIYEPMPGYIKKR